MKDSQKDYEEMKYRTNNQINLFLNKFNRTKKRIEYENIKDMKKINRKVNIGICFMILCFVYSKIKIDYEFTYEHIKNKN